MILNERAERNRNGASLPQAPSLFTEKNPLDYEGDAGYLRRISIELSRTCNLNCLYCYASASKEHEDMGLTPKEVTEIVDEAVALGAKRIVVVGGGEPLLHPAMSPSVTNNLVDYVGSLEASISIFTNCTLVTNRLAVWLADRPVSIIGKLNSLDPETQDFLAGVPHTFQSIMNGIETLIAAGFTKSNPSRMALETVICRQNYDEIPNMWRWMRERNIIPFVEIMTIQGRAKSNQDIICFSTKESPIKYKELFDEILRIDQDEFGYTWKPHPPHIARSCDLYHTNCYVNCRGDVQPCVGVDIEMGHLRVGMHRSGGKPLVEILDCDFFEKCRRIEKYVGEPCRSCDLLGECYGCRGNAWNLTGNVFAGDTACWRNLCTVDSTCDISSTSDSDPPVLPHCQPHSDCLWNKS